MGSGVNKRLRITLDNNSDPILKHAPPGANATVVRLPVNRQGKRNETVAVAKWKLFFYRTVNISTYWVSPKVEEINRPLKNIFTPTLQAISRHDIPILLYMKDHSKSYVCPPIERWVPVYHRKKIISDQGVYMDGIHIANARMIN